MNWITKGLTQRSLKHEGLSEIDNRYDGAVMEISFYVSI